MIATRTSTWVSRIGGVLLLVLYGTPLVWLLTTSLKSNTDAFRGLQTLFVFQPTLAAYQRLLASGLGQSAVNSVLIAAGATAVTLLFAVPAAYALARVRVCVRVCDHSSPPSRSRSKRQALSTAPPSGGFSGRSSCR